MSEIELADLELKVTTLLTNLERLKMENDSLQQELIRSSQKCQQLMHKNKEAATKIKQIISKLRNAAS